MENYFEGLLSGVAVNWELSQFGNVLSKHLSNMTMVRLGHLEGVFDLHV